MIGSEVDTIIQTQLPAHEPGVAVAIIKDGQIMHCQGYGRANLEWQLPITPQTVFAIGSITKPFTATIIMLLEKQGKLHLDDLIQTYLPDYPTHGRNITLTHLLTHTSGIPNFVTQPGFWEQHAQTKKSIDEVIVLFKDLPLDFEPGTRYSYSNSGYYLLGCIIEKLMDMSYEDALQTQIFDPLGMTHSYYLRNEAIIPYRADGYMPTEQGYQHAILMDAALKYTAGGMGSTLEDMILWDAALRAGQLPDYATQERMYTPVQLADGTTENYGLGWAPGQYRQHKFICHAGGIPGFSAFYGYFPDDTITIIILSNRHGSDVAGLARQISHLILTLPPPKRTPVSHDPQLLKKMTGTYSSVFGKQEIREEEQKLLYPVGKVVHTLVPMGKASFYWADDEDFEVHFENENKQGIYERIRVIQPFFWFTAERVEA